MGLLTAKCGIADRYGCVCTHIGGGVTLSQPGFSDDDAVGRTNSCQNTKYELFFCCALNSKHDCASYLNRTLGVWFSFHIQSLLKFSVGAGSCALRSHSSHSSLGIAAEMPRLAAGVRSVIECTLLCVRQRRITDVPAADGTHTRTNVCWDRNKFRAAEKKKREEITLP